MTNRSGPEVLRAVADVIDAEPKRYFQGNWKTVGVDHPCGSAFCVSGWAVALELGEDMLNVNGHVSGMGHAGVVGADLLGLDYTTAYHLFNEEWKPKDGMSVPEALRRLADGEALDVLSAGEWDESAETWHHRGPECNIECAECYNEFYGDDDE